MGKLRKNNSGFSAVETILVLIVVAIIGFVGWYVWKAKQNTNKTLNNANSALTGAKPEAKPKSTKPSTAASIPPAQSSGYLVIKEWGVKVQFDDAKSVTYKLTGQEGGNTPDNSAQYVDGAALLLLPSITSDPGCQELGIGINRAKPLTDQAKSNAINGYVYDITGGPGACNGDPGGVNGSINQLRGRIDGQEFGQGKYTITAN